MCNRSDNMKFMIVQEFCVDFGSYGRKSKVYVGLCSNM
jgi:hypothetical protein